MAKAKLFTHTDLDGVGCAIVGKWAYGDALDYELCDYEDINEKIEAFFTSGKAIEYDQIYITDISVDEDIAEMLDRHYSARVVPGGVKLLDHHATAEWLNKYEWASVHVYHPFDSIQIKACGTSLFDIYLIKEGLLPEDYAQGLFTDKVRSYDTWDWQPANDLHAKKINDLLYLIGQSKFIERFIANTSIAFTEHEQLLLDIEERRIEKYIEKKMKQVTKHKIEGFRVAAVFAESNQSLLGNRIAAAHEDIDFVVLIDPGNPSVSLRAVKEGVHVGEFAKMYGGGGHAKSAGMPFSEDLVYGWVGEIYDEHFKV